MSYYQKYRSEKVADLDLVSVRAAFGTMMDSGKIAHAYLLVGPRGLGKTSAARILAKLINCEKNYSKEKLNRKLVEPCGECDACVSIKKGSAVDVMEIDAASHRGIDDIRDLRERVNLAPAALPKKVYIIDEVHMLTTEAFSALLKTLEEPPEQVMFVLATTEAHKVPETIISRCVRINFTKATAAELMTSLSRAAKGEGLKIDEEALVILATGLDGSFREGHKLLEQLANRYGPITAENVGEVLKLVSNSRVEAILTAVDAGETDKVVGQLCELEAEGVEVMSLITKLLLVLQARLRKGVESKEGWSRSAARLTRKLVEVVPRVKISPLPLLPLEMVLVEAALSNRQSENGGRKELVQMEPARVLPPERKTKMDFDQVVSGWPELLARLQP
ncbi:MAG: DNA polymerase III subunit gamma/tau, partial [Patescibacteria group bacterium]